MQPNSAFEFRIRLAKGFLNEAQQDVSLERWRSCVDNCQLCVENAAKAILALIGPVGRSHAPGQLLRLAIQNARFPDIHIDKILQLADLADLLGNDIHIQSDYGDESLQRTPWELFTQSAAEKALVMAEEAHAIAVSLSSRSENAP